MKAKVLKLGGAAKEVKVQQGTTIEHIIQASGFNREYMRMTLIKKSSTGTIPTIAKRTTNTSGAGGASVIAGLVSIPTCRRQYISRYLS